MARVSFPFSAIVGQERMKTALVLCAVDPAIGGVLIRGQKGTAKSTAVRSFASLLPPVRTVRDCAYRCDPDQPESWEEGCRQRFPEPEKAVVDSAPAPLVELPLNADEDRLVGTLHLEDVLREGVRRFEPGLLASAHRGLLYVDEVNLLADHLVDVILDVAASGINVVEREGLSFRHPARFHLVGTMNPEEGELRPQFLDRFGLCVSVEALQGPDERRAVLERRLAYDRAPDAVRTDWAPMDALLGQQIRDARERLPRVVVPPDVLGFAAAAAAEVSAAGHRGELATVRAARALAALLERDRVGLSEVAEAARLALPHRVRGDLTQTPESGVAAVERALTTVAERADAAPRADQAAGVDGEAQADGVDHAWVDDDWLDEMMTVPGPHGAPGMLFPFLKKKRASMT